mgnify:CR=1 FL=1
MPKSKKNILKEKEGIIPPEGLNPKAAARLRSKKRHVPKADELVVDLLKGDITALSRGITLIESTANKHQIQGSELVKNCLPHSGNSLRIGLTGVPGVGKSTFIEQLGIHLLNLGHKVAVLAVDPSSSLSKGSILGDKTRMEQLVQQPNAYIRPSASGDSLGGVARKTREAIILCEAAGFDVIIIETVGVGQSETAVHSMTDFFLLLKLAGAGDELQGIKRGIIEMADAIVINKADGENKKAARQAKLAFNRALHLYPPKDNGWVPKTLEASALEGTGIDKTWKLLMEFQRQTQYSGDFDTRRNEQLRYWLEQTISHRLLSNFYGNKKIKKALESQLDRLKAQQTTPYHAAMELLALSETN